MEQRLGGDASAVEAGAAYRPVLHHRNPQPKLCRADRRHIAPRPCADDNQLILLCHFLFLSFGLL